MLVKLFAVKQVKQLVNNHIDCHPEHRKRVTILYSNIFSTQTPVAIVPAA